MSNLLVDIGNTHLRWAVDSDEGFKVGDAQLPADINPSELIEKYWFNIKPEHALISCVSSNNTVDTLLDTIDLAWKIPAKRLISPVAGGGIRNAYTEPEKLGSDRWAAMVAAYYQAQGSVCIVDCGTAMTLDAVDKDGQHLGGLIVPGIKASQECLKQATSLKFETNITDRDLVLLGQSTQECIDKGSFHQLSSLVNNTFQHLIEQDKSMVIFLTGGSARLIQAGLSMDSILEPDLVLKGLAIILRTKLEASIS